MGKRSIVVIMLLALSIVGIGIVFLVRSPATTGDEAAESASIRLAWLYDMAEVGLFVAKDGGHFTENGIEMEIEQGGFGLDPIRLVAAGNNDFGVAGAGNLLFARAQGVPVVAIGAEFQSTPVGFIVRADAGIESFADFRGKRVGVQTGSDTDVLYRALLAESGMSNQDIREVPIQFDPTPFVAGEIDVLPGYVTNQPVTLRSNGIEVNVLSAASQGLGYYGNVYITTERMINENPELVRKFLKAANAGWQSAFDDRATAIAAIQARSQDFEEADLEKIYDAVIPYIRSDEGSPILSMSEKRWQTTARVLEDAGLLEEPIDISAAFTNEFLAGPD